MSDLMDDGGGSDRHSGLDKRGGWSLVLLILLPVVLVALPALWLNHFLDLFDTFWNH